MRLGGPIQANPQDPIEWIDAARTQKYTACYAPSVKQVGAVEEFAPALVKAATKHDIVIAEVGAWSNPLDADPAKAKEAIQFCQESLQYADMIGACCCVNIVGSRNAEKWDGPCPENFSEDTFDLIVATTREIVDSVKPERTYFALETMPWIFPSSPDEYLSLLEAIDRPSVAVHLDPVNMINSPKLAFNTSDFLKECFQKLGPLIKSCHAKDIILREKLTVHLDECAPGTGHLNYSVFLDELNGLSPDIPLMLEHLPMEAYPAAADYIRSVADENNITIL